uniref:MOB kinase activator 3A n=1 Tax=Cyanistes caeruleus TaxID=156563 RepID=A0A8C0VUK2_CYACU
MSHALKQVFNKDKTFRPKRKFEPGTQRFELHKKAQASLNAGLDLKVAVQLPPGEEQNDWVAVHVVDFFNRINLIYGTISDYCTEQSCPVMSGGPKYEYRWQDEHKYRKPTALSAPQYMNLLMDWIEVQINNEDIFPTNVGDAAAQLTPVAELCASPVGSAVSSSQLFCSAEIPRAAPDPTSSHGYLEAVKQEAALRAVSL